MKLLVIFLFSSFVFAVEINQPNSAVDPVQLMAEKKFDQALEKWQVELQKTPTNLAVLNNVALTYVALGKKGYALGYWLKSIKIDPNFEPAKQGINFLHKQLPSNGFAIKKTDFETFREGFLVSISENILFFLVIATLFGFGFVWIRYIKSVKVAHQNELAHPDVPFFNWIFSVLLFFSCSLFVFKMWDYFTPRAVIVSASVSLKIAPGQDQAKLVDLIEGTEVIIGANSGDWIQIKLPGNYTGWVHRNDILMIL